MGNKQSILCCSPSCCSTRRNAVQPVLVDVHRRLETPSEHPKNSDTPKRASGASAGNGGSPTNISDTQTQLNINQQKEKIQHKISKELKIKDGAERIRKLIKDKKNLQEVDDVLYDSTLKLDVLYRRLQHLNACIHDRDAVHLPGICEDWNEENAVLPADDAMNEPQESNLDNVIMVEDIIKEPEVINVDNAFLVEEIINDLIQSIIYNTSPAEDIIKEPEVINMGKALLSVDEEIIDPEKTKVENIVILTVEEVINEPEVSITDDAFLPEEDITGLEVFNVAKALLPPDKEIKDLEMTNMENIVLSVGEELNKMDVSITEKALLPHEEEITRLEACNVEFSFPESEEGSIQQQPLLSLEDFRFCSVLGRGGFGKVLLAEHRNSEKMVAIKAIKKMEVIKKEMVDCLMHEKRIFQAASRGYHPFLVNLFASFQTIDYTFFVMEYASGGDLCTQLQKSLGSFSTSRARFYTACVVLGLEYLHQEEIIYRDLKLENVVLDKEGFAKITDFGLGKEGIVSEDPMSTRCGTLSYAAPEILTQPSYTRAVDWWSLGVLLYAMLLGEFPFSGYSKAEVMKNIISGKIRYPFYMARRSRLILRSLFQRNPGHRLGAGKDGAEDVKNHPFFREINWSKLFSRKVKPPFVPTIRSLRDTRNFEGMFTSLAPVLTPQHQSLTEEEQDAFSDFDWSAMWED